MKTRPAYSQTINHTPCIIGSAPFCGKAGSVHYDVIYALCENRGRAWERLVEEKLNNTKKPQGYTDAR